MTHAHRRLPETAIDPTVLYPTVIDSSAVPAASTLGAALEVAISSNPGQVLVRAATGENPPLTMQELDIRSTRIAGFLRTLGEGSAATALVAAPLGEHLLTAILACQKAGLTPCLVPVDLDEAALMARLEQLEAPVAISIGQFGALRPLLSLRGAALRSFHLRLAAGFGPSVPEGVADLDAVMAQDTETAALENVQASNQIRIMTGQDGTASDTTLTDADLLSASRMIAQALGVQALGVQTLGVQTLGVQALHDQELTTQAPDKAPDAYSASRIISCMVGHDLACLASSIGLGLVSGLEVTPLGLFSLARLMASLSGSLATHLVVPASIETALVQTGLTRHAALKTLILVHETSQAPLPAMAAREGCAIIDLWRPTAGRISITHR